MKRRNRVSTVSGIPKNVKPRAMALSGRDSALAMPKLNAARTSACDLERFGKMLLIWLVQWFRLAHGRLLLWGFCYSPQRWGAFARESTLSYTPPEKCKAVSP